MDHVLLPVRYSWSPLLIVCKMLSNIPQAGNCLLRLKCSFLSSFQGGSCAKLQTVTHVHTWRGVRTNVHISGVLVQLTKVFIQSLRMTGTVSSFFRKFAPRCSVCKEPIMPAPGQEETVRIVALDRDFHVHCYRCEVSILITWRLGSKGWLNFITASCYTHDRHPLL